MITASAKGIVRFKDSNFPTTEIIQQSGRIARVLKYELAIYIKWKNEIVITFRYISHFGEPHRPDDFLVIYVKRSSDLIPLVLAGLEASSHFDQTKYFLFLRPVSASLRYLSIGPSIEDVKFSQLLGTPSMSLTVIPFRKLKLKIIFGNTLSEANSVFNSHQ